MSPDFGGLDLAVLERAFQAGLLVAIFVLLVVLIYERIERGRR